MKRSKGGLERRGHQYQKALQARPAQVASIEMNIMKGKALGWRLQK
jgi:hypothetical protein